MATKTRKTSAGAPKSAPPKAPKGANVSTHTAEKAGVGNKTHPENKRVPREAVIKREPVTEEATKVTASPEVQGNKAMMIVDILNSRPVHVSLVDGIALTPDTDGRLVYIEGPVANDLKSIDKAKGLFAIKKDGTVIYNPRGFDEVPKDADFDMLDIVKLIEHNHSGAGVAAAKKADQETAAAEKKQADEDKKKADEKAAADKKAADTAKKAK